MCSLCPPASHRFHQLGLVAAVVLLRLPSSCFQAQLSCPLPASLSSWSVLSVPWLCLARPSWVSTSPRLCPPSLGLQPSSRLPASGGAPFLTYSHSAVPPEPLGRHPHQLVGLHRLWSAPAFMCVSSVISCPESSPYQPAAALPTFFFL